jgi:glucokinase
MKLVVVDVGGTHIRFAVARLQDGQPPALDHQAIVRTAEFPDLKSAWAHFAATVSEPLPRAAVIAVACPADGPILRLTNIPWTIRTDTLTQDLGLDRALVLNDFVAVCHAVANARHGDFKHVCGPEFVLPTDGVVSVVGPGTGLGVAQIVITGGAARIVPTEGGHIGFAPNDAIDEAILARMRARHGRVSVERIASGPSLVDIYDVMAQRRGITVAPMTDKALWPLALAGADDLAAEALERFCFILGAVGGDIALAQGAHALVIAGGVGLRLADHLHNSGFRSGLIDKGRFRARLESLPVALITTPHPGLIGAAWAFELKR